MLSTDIAVIMTHGYNTFNSIENVGRLRSLYIGNSINPKIIEYGKFSLLDTFLRNKKIAQDIASLCKEMKEHGKYVIVVAHSNGCAIVNIAANEYGAEIDRAVYITPALKRDAKIAESMKELDVWFSDSDNTVRAANLVPFHDWGDMGAVGYKGKSKKVINYDLQKYTDIKVRHSTMFERDNKDMLARPIVETSLRERTHEL